MTREEVQRWHKNLGRAGEQRSAAMTEASLSGRPLRNAVHPWVENHDNQTLLRSAVFDELGSAIEVRDRAVALIDRLNGAMALSRNSKPLRFAGITQFMPDGTRHRTIFAESVQSLEMFAGEITVTVTGPDGRPIPAPPPTPSDVQVWAALAEADDFFGRCPDLFRNGDRIVRHLQNTGNPHPQVWPWRRGISVAKLGTKKRKSSYPSGRRTGLDMPNASLRRPLSQCSCLTNRRLLGQLLRRALSPAAS